jgi:transcriptional regulator with XRE-family HTH domain
VRYREAEIFGQTIRQARLERHWTQEELADKAGLTATYVGQLERGDKIPSLTVVLKLARGLAIAPSRLLEGFSLTVLRNIEL